MWIYLPVQEGVDYIKLVNLEVKSGRDYYSDSEGSGSERSSIGAFEIRFLKVSPGAYSGFTLNQIRRLVELIYKYPL